MAEVASVEALMRSTMDKNARHLEGELARMTRWLEHQAAELRSKEEHIQAELETRKEILLTFYQRERSAQPASQGCCCIST